MHHFSGRFDGHEGNAERVAQDQSCGMPVRHTELSCSGSSLRSPWSSSWGASCFRLNQADRRRTLLGALVVTVIGAMVLVVAGVVGNLALLYLSPAAGGRHTPVTPSRGP